MSRFINAENLSKVKYHNLPYTHIVPNGENVESYERGWNDAIDAIIENEPTADVVEVTSCKYDCVSREKVRDLLHEYMNNDDFTIGYLDDCYCEMPSLDVRENVKGEWITHKNAEISYDRMITNYECNSCHTWSRYHSNFCPNCGADMRGET